MRENTYMSNAVALSQNGRYLAVGYNLTKKHNIINNNSQQKIYEHQNYDDNNVDGENKLPELMVDKDVCIRIFEIFTGRVICVKHLVCNTKRTKIITSMCWSFDTKYLFAGTSNGTFMRYNVTSKRCNTQP